MAIVPRDRSDRLDSWKAIADYLGRDVRTLLRWEKEKGLPVHRVPGGKRQAVFAFARELDEWLVQSGESSSESGSAQAEGREHSEFEFRRAASSPGELQEAAGLQTNEPASPVVGAPRVPETGPRLLSLPRNRERGPIAPPSAFNLRPYVAAAGILAAMVAGVSVVWLLLRHPAQHSAALTQKRLTFNSSDSPISYPALSPDGNYVAYSDPAGFISG